MSGKNFFLICIFASLILLVVLCWNTVADTFRPVAAIAELVWPTSKPANNNPSVVTLSTTSTSSPGIIGSSFEGKDGMSPKFSVTFLDSTQVNLYADGSQIGNTCTYVMDGDNVVITHACGTWHLDKRGNNYFNEELNWTFIKRK